MGENLIDEKVDNKLCQEHPDGGDVHRVYKPWGGRGKLSWHLPKVDDDQLHEVFQGLDVEISDQVVLAVQEIGLKNL
jgi:hypothetical protein